MNYHTRSGAIHSMNGTETPCLLKDEVLGASVENYEPDMYDSITLNDTQVCKRHRDHGNRGTSLCMAFSDENG